jgi:cytochrome c oxidase assembly factor CtaG
VAWAAFAAVLVGTHVPAFYDLALREPVVHALEHALYLWAAVLFWTPLLAAEPLPARLGGVGAIAYLLTAMVPMTLVGVWLLLAGDVQYPHYAATAGALADQRAGAAAMWLGGTVTLTVAVAACGWSALAREERRARAREAHAARRPPAALPSSFAPSPPAATASSPPQATGPVPADANIPTVESEGAHG